MTSAPATGSRAWRSPRAGLPGAAGGGGAHARAADLARNEKAFIAWSGLKGAVPVLLAAFGLLGPSTGQRIYGLVFVVVLASVLGQGTRAVGRGAPADPDARARAAALELTVASVRSRPGLRTGRRAGVSWDGVSVEDLPLPDDAWVTLIVRDGLALRPDARLVMRAGDRVLVIADHPGGGQALGVSGPSGGWSAGAGGVQRPRRRGAERSRVAARR